MKIALYKMMYGDGKYSTDLVCRYDDGEKDSGDTIRISEPINVEFPPLTDAEVIARQLDACDAKELEIREKFQEALNRLKDERARIQCLTHALDMEGVP